MGARPMTNRHTYGMRSVAAIPELLMAVEAGEGGVAASIRVAIEFLFGEYITAILHMTRQWVSLGTNNATIRLYRRPERDLRLASH